ncbi:ABC transporter permease [Nocardiopsis sp. MG754419]|uniref:ABC transporter permease n=1 Tax=Nocardiopsis sp. MG754419 TaxID=2259865 RepID=UPI001BA902ED|nr:ABC transporter permease [Nocardiopsis sp. MG754419]MBR8745242.1 ABC transporter permease [Nocardiopsis sp. MG754419]
MSTTPSVAVDATASDLGPSPIDSRPAYLAFAFAFVFGHGAFAVSGGPDPLLDLPLWVPLALLACGIVPGVVSSLMAAKRAQNGAGPADVLSEKLLGNAWATVFIALALGITGLTTTFDIPSEAQDVLWPTGAVFVVGLINVAEGAARRNVLHYSLGTALALIATAALLLPPPGPFWALSLAGSTAYLLAAFFENRRIAALR